MIVKAPVIRYHGGKFRLAPWVMKHFPPHPIYDETLQGWERRTTKARISGGRGTQMRDEVVWINKACSNALRGGGLFSLEAVA